MGVEVKICGLTRPEDAAFAAAAGASYLGVVFAGGPREVTAERAEQVRRAAPEVPLLGVFGGQSFDDILRICEAAGLHGAQLHGAHATRTARRLKAAGLRVWRVARIAGPTDLERIGESVDASDVVLVEPQVPHSTGGSGVSLDLAVAREARARLAGHPMALAGGLRPETVAAAVALVRPDIVDVSSGVERRPGVKDRNKIARFLEATLGHSSIS